MRQAPAEPHDGDGEDDDTEGKVQVDESRHRRIAANMRHGPGENELRDQQKHDEPMQRFGGAGVTRRLRCHAILVHALAGNKIVPI